MFRDYINKFLLDHNIVEVIWTVIPILYFIFRDNYFYFNNLLVILYFYICLFYFNFSHRFQFIISLSPSIRAIYGGSRVVFYSNNNKQTCNYCGLRKSCCLGDSPSLPNFLPEKGLYHTWWYLSEALFSTFPKDDVKFGGQICRLLRCINSSNLTFIKGYSLPVQYKRCNFNINYLNPNGSFILLCLEMYYRRSSKGKKNLLGWLLVDFPISGEEYLFFKQGLLRLLTEKEFNLFAAKLRKEQVGDLFISILRICLVKGRLPVKRRIPSGGLEYTKITNCSECGSKSLLSGHCYKCYNSKQD